MVLSLPVRLVVVALFYSISAICSVSAICYAETVLLDFSSPTCGPCQQMRPVVQRLMSDGLPVREIDIMREPQLAAQFGVAQVPTFLVVVDGKAVDRSVGLTSYRQLRRMMLRHLPAALPRQAVMPLGQSPSTFATSASPQVTAVAQGGSDMRAAADDLYQPQPNRIVSLQDPARQMQPPQTHTNPFTGHAPPNSARPAPSGQVSPQGSSPPGLLSLAHQRLLASTVKITVDDQAGKSVGTGTVVDTRQGEALVLTCGHIFRSSAGKGPINVTTFHVRANGATPAQVYRGHLIDFDLERDLALVSIRPTSPMQAVTIAAAPTTLLATGAAVTSVGCNHGQNPTAIDSRVVSIDRYQGSPNVEVAGAPVEGRSGGGLFNPQGQLVGVCYAADPQAGEGIYAGLPSIYAKLDSLNLTMVYQPAATPPTATPVKVAPATVAVTQPPLAVRGQEPDLSSIGATPPITPASNPARQAMSATEQAALEEIQRRGANSEVICIIRPQDPNGKSEVITLNNVSPGFVKALANRRTSVAR